MQLSDAPIGSTVRFSTGKTFIVLAHTEMGTQVQPTARVAKQVTDPKTGKTKRFSSAAAPRMVSSGAPCELDLP